MVDITAIIDVYGLPVAFLVVVIYFYISSTKVHKRERDEWRSDMKDTTSRYDERQKEATEVLRQLTAVIERIGKK